MYFFSTTCHNHGHLKTNSLAPRPVRTTFRAWPKPTWPLHSPPPWGHCDWAVGPFDHLAKSCRGPGTPKNNTNDERQLFKVNLDELGKTIYIYIYLLYMTVYTNIYQDIPTIPSKGDAICFVIVDSCDLWANLWVQSSPTKKKKVTETAPASISIIHFDSILPEQFPQLIRLARFVPSWLHL